MKKVYLQRLAFGREKKLNLGLGLCPCCEVQRGVNHKAGCVCEECANCSKPVVFCACQCLDPHDADQVIKGVILSMTEDDIIREGGKIKDMDNLSYTEQAVVSGYMEGLLGLTPCGVGNDGFSTYDLNEVALQLCMNDTEKAHLLAAMEAVG